MNNAAILSKQLKWGLLLLSALVAMVAVTMLWPHPDPATAGTAIKETMVLSASGTGIASCDDPTKPLKCTAYFDSVTPKNAEFQLLLSTNIDFEIAGFGAEVYFGGLTYNEAACATEIVMPNNALTSFCLTASKGERRLGGATGSSIPYPAANPGGGNVPLALLSVHCATLGTFTVGLTDYPGSGFGAIYFDVPNGNEVNVPVVGQLDFGNGLVDIADKLEINCALDFPTPTPTRTPAPTFTPTNTPPPTSQESEINITKRGRYALPKTCFDVLTDQQALFFTVCDNNFQGAPDQHAICDADSTTECEDSDPTPGSVRVTVDPGDYRVIESKPPPNHVADPAKLQCAAVGGGKCELTFINAPLNSPWFPEDVDGSGSVTIGDVFQVAGAFGDTK